MLKDKTIIIIGASSGLGSVLADNLFTNNNVIGTYNRHKIKAKYETIKCDVTKEKEVKKLFSYALKKYHEIDVVINMISYTEDTDLKDKSYKSFLRVINANLGGTFIVNKYAALNMQEGVILNMSSMDAHDTFSAYSIDYAASKAGIENITKNFAKMMPNLKIYALAPAWIDTKAVLEMDPNYLKREMERNGQQNLLKKEAVVLKIINIITSSNYKSGNIIRMDGKDE